VINNYRRAARTAAELGLGWFDPLDQVPELHSCRRPRGKCHREVPQFEAVGGRGRPDRAKPRVTSTEGGTRTQTPQDSGFLTAAFAILRGYSASNRSAGK
jgi:hypothetical protein